MTKLLSTLLVAMSLSFFGAGAVSAFDSSPASVSQDGDHAKKKHGKKKHGKKKHGKKKGKGRKRHHKKS